MKLKKIDPIGSWDDCVVIINLSLFLSALSIQSATQLNDDVEEIRQDNFCGDCTSVIDNCECDGHLSHSSVYDDEAYFED